MQQPLLRRSFVVHAFGVVGGDDGVLRQAWLNLILCCINLVVVVVVVVILWRRQACCESRANAGLFVKWQ